MKQIIIDASVALTFYLKDEDDEKATALLQSLDEYKIIVPQHWWAEVSNGLLMAERRKRISSSECIEAMTKIMAFEPEIIVASPVDFAEEIIPLAQKYKLTSYDTSYLYLALRKKAILATLDKELKKAAVKAGVTVFAA